MTQHVKMNTLNAKAKIKPTKFRTEDWKHRISL